MSYTLDVYLRRAIPACNFLDYALFVTFFPHLVAGPIMRPTELVPQFEQPRRASAAQLRFRVALMTLGLFNKFVLVDTFLSDPAEKNLQRQGSAGTAWRVAGYARLFDWIRASWPGPLIIKGILDPNDARAAADMGADGIVVSNHGGRQLDGVLSITCVLPYIADAVQDRLTVLADSGVRSGLGVVRMLALGAKGVLLGSAWLFALAACGGSGVTQLLDMIAREMRVAMTLTGAQRIGTSTAPL
jgi:NAD(P)H-dependent flavin oxidoreductase YrpB (nitropropane dioxygenase family)